MAKLSKALILIFIIIPSLLKAQSSVEGTWKGALTIGLDFSVNFVLQNGAYTGTIDIPAQGAMGLPLSNVNFSDPSVHFELAVPNGTAIFEGKLAGDSITGKFAQNGMTADFYLTRGALEEKKEEGEVLPYKEEEVTFNNGDIKLTGTLSLPDYAGHHPAVVLITGSGAQTRDEDIFGFKIFKVIADRLTRSGIAVLRYDDRGMGGSTGKVSTSTTADFAGDVVEAVKYLQTRNDIRKDAIGLMGHSEGGVIAPLSYTMDNDIAFLILMAGTGVVGKDLLYVQSRLIMEADKSPESQIKRDSVSMRLMFDAIEAGKDLALLKDDLIKIAYESYDESSAEDKKLLGGREKYAETSYQNQVREIGSNWFRYFLNYDPVPPLEKTKVPVLLLFGENDLQVPPSQNKKPMENALTRAGNKDVTSIVISKANHLFQASNTGSPSEYGKLPKEFAPGFLDTVTNWILERFPASR